MKEESKKAGLKLNIHKTKIITSSLIISWQGEGETDFTFWAPKSLQVVTNLDNILKGRDITLPTKVCVVKAMVFLIVIYGCESWTMKKLNAKELRLLNCGVG